jgi:hypothetical protein
MTMDCDEHSLREMLASQLGSSVVGSILKTISEGKETTILLADGSTITLGDIEVALRVLHEDFGWASSVPREPASPRAPLSLFGKGQVSVDDRAAVHVLDMCHRMEREFTLGELVARVMDERPDMIIEFAEAWGRLISSKFVRVRRRGEPCTYVVAGR